MKTNTTVTEGTFKGGPTLALDSASEYPFRFGLKKAQLIVAHLDAIKAFVAKHTPAAAIRDPGEDGADRFTESTAN